MSYKTTNQELKKTHEFECECTAQNPLSFFDIATIKTIKLLDPVVQWTTRFDLKKLLTHLTPYFYQSFDTSSMEFKNILLFAGCDNVQACEQLVEGATAYTGTLESAEMTLFLLFVCDETNTKMAFMKCSNINKYASKSKNELK